MSCYIICLIYGMQWDVMVYYGVYIYMYIMVCYGMLWYVMVCYVLEMIKMND